MGHFLRATALSAAVLAAPAAATDWDSVGGWDVHELGTTRCVVGQVFAQQGLTFGIIMSIDGEVRVFATGAGWPARAGEAIDAQVAFDGKPIVQGPSVGIEQQRNRGFVAAADKGLLDTFAVARRLTIRTASGVVKDGLPIFGSAEALAQGRRCLSGLREERGLRPAAPVIAERTRRAPSPGARVAASAPMAGAPMAVAPMAGAPMAGAPMARAPVVRALATRAVPKASLASWLGDTDYPAAALQAGQEGATTVRLAIDRSGAVSGCEVARTSGSNALDNETCRVFLRRGRYRPALDNAGTPVATVEQQTVRWKLPD